MPHPPTQNPPTPPPTTCIWWAPPASPFVRMRKRRIADFLFPRDPEATMFGWGYRFAPPPLDRRVDEVPLINTLPLSWTLHPPLFFPPSPLPPLPSLTGQGKSCRSYLMAYLFLRTALLSLRPPEARRPIQHVGF